MATDIQAIPVKTIDGQDSSLADYAGQVLLVVNVASKCGLTPQYEGLGALYRRYKDEGFTILAFPANDFRGQEPGTEAEIAEFCEQVYSVDFPLFSKIAVTGADRHPLYDALVAAQPNATSVTGDRIHYMLAKHSIEQPDPSAVTWNFEKFLVGRDGTVVDRFAPDTLPEDPALVIAIERELFASE